MFTLTLPFRLFSFDLRVELVRLSRKELTTPQPPPTRVELLERFHRTLSPHLLRDVGLDDSRR